MATCGGSGNWIEDAVHGVVGVERVDAFEQRGLGGARRQFDELGADADLGAVADLVAHVDLRRRILAHQDHGETRAHAVRRDHPLDALLVLDAQLRPRRPCRR